jgi:putative hemolysin
MSDQTTPLGDKLARIARGILLAAIAVVIALIIVGPKNGGLPNPLSVGRANAEGGICAAPGYIMMPVKQGGVSRFCVCDTTKQVICIYEMNGEKLRLVSVRKFDKDTEIFDASLQVGAKAPEGHTPGLNRREAGLYAEAIKAYREKAEKKK